MNIPACHVVQDILHLLWQWPIVSLDKEDSLVPEGTWPVRVNVEVAGNVGRDHHRLRLVAVKKGLKYILGQKA